MLIINRFASLCLLYFFFVNAVGRSDVSPMTLATRTYLTRPATEFADLYDALNLKQAGLERAPFDYALRGLAKMNPARSVLSIVDLSQPSSHKRLYIIDLSARKLLFHTYVSHGRNSGQLMAGRFSNQPSSYQSSLGFYRTLGSYQGKHGLSLQLQGLELGVNDNAFGRAIVLHGAEYVCENFIRQTGRLGRSQGCPAVPSALSQPIINAVKGGSCLFIYAPDASYLRKSSYLANPYTSV
jgi:L,D-transpeptidase catalytic domain